MRRTFKDSVYPSKQQRRLLDAQREERRWLENDRLAARRDAWDQRQESVRLYDHQATLPALQGARPALADVPSPVAQTVAVRLDLAFQAVCRRVRAGEKPSSPRSRGKGRDTSSASPQVSVGGKRDTGAQRLRLHGVGAAQVVLRRPLDATPKTATISRSRTGQWRVCCSCERLESSLVHERACMSARAGGAAMSPTSAAAASSTSVI
jgi:putative transposase